MNIFNKIINLLSRKSVFTSPRFGDFSRPSEYSNDKDELSAYEKIIWFSSCIDAVARDSTSTGFHFKKTNTDEEISIDRIPQEILVPILKGFGKLSFPELLKLIIEHRLLTGNGYLLKTQTNAFSVMNKQTDAFYPIRPDYIKAVTTGNGLKLLYYEITFPDGSRFDIPEENMIHFIQNPIYNPFIGVGNVTKARLVAENETKSDEYVNEFMTNKASPSLAITETTRRNPEDVERLKDYLRKDYSKKKNAGKVLYMNGDDVKVQPLALTQKDMQFLEQKVFNRQAILSINGVPGVVLSIPDGSNKAIAQVMTRNYYKNTINPTIKDIENVLNSQYVHTIDPSISISFNKHATGDAESVQVMINNAIITPNRAANLLGEKTDKTDPAREKYYISNQVIPLELSGANVAFMAGSDDDSKGHDCTEHKNVDLHDPKNVEAIVDHFDKSATNTKKFQKKFLRRSLNDRNAVEDKYTPLLAKFFERSLKRILKNIKDNESLIKSIKALDEDTAALIYDINEDNEALEKLAQSMHTSGVQRSVSSLNVLMGANVSLSINNPFIKNAIGRLGKLIKRVNESTKKEVEALILKEIDNDGNVNTLTKALQTKFDQFKGYRARRIARTEARMAWDAGAEVMYTEVGVKEVDIIGCTQFEPDSDCGKQNIPIVLLSTLRFHPNHIGSPAPSLEP